LIAASGPAPVAAARKAHADATPAATPSEADWRTPDPQDVLVIDTNKGRIIFEMAPQVAPLSVARVRELARASFYDGRAFFRVIDNFMDQTGDPTDTGTGGSTKPDLPGEFTFRRGSDTPMVVVEKASGQESGFIGALPVVGQTLDLGVLTADHRVKAWASFCAGVGGMARAQTPDSGNSQFFLMRAATPHLDQNYTPWGRAIAGQDVINAIKVGEPVDAPQDKMITVRVLADIPAGERPSVRVIDTAGPWFRAQVERLRVAKVVDFSMCDLDLPSQVK
jgi:peptidylprolyl isomerase